MVFWANHFARCWRAVAFGPRRTRCRLGFADIDDFLYRFARFPGIGVAIFWFAGQQFVNNCGHYWIHIWSQGGQVCGIAVQAGESGVRIVFTDKGHLASEAFIEH